MPSCFSRVRLCATPWTAAYQASPSMGFSRKEHWSGLPFPSPIYMHNLCINHNILLFFYQIIPEWKYIYISDMACIRSDSSFKSDFMKGVGRNGILCREK